MSSPHAPIDPDLLRRLQDDAIDSYDEELEMEVDDRLLEGVVGMSDEDREARRMYFRELFRLQGELVKLQDWVVSKKERIVVLSKAAMRRAKAAPSSASPSA
jgi:polyphosphate kinase 2 (PPK2 family)